EIQKTVKQPLPVDITCKIISDTCKGLHAAHSAVDAMGSPLSIVHRDATPHNILLSRDGFVKLTDFGVAKAAHTLAEREDQLVGKLHYISPEQLAGHPATPCSDVFSVGVTMLEALLGAKPFQGA